MVSDSVITGISTLNYLWDVSTSKTQSGFLRLATGGWELGGIFSASSGEPFTPQLAEGDVLGQNNTDRFAYPNRVNAPGCSGNAVNPGNVTDYIKLQCFVIPPVATINGVNYIQLGNVGRNILTGLGLMDFDFSVVKNTKVPQISEAFNVQLRLDIFNLFNRANFNPPVTNQFILDPTLVTPGTVAQPGPNSACNASNLGNSGCTVSAGAFDGHDGTATTSRQMQLSLKLLW